MFGLLPPGVRGFEDERGNQWFYAAEVCKQVQEGIATYYAPFKK